MGCIAYSTACKYKSQGSLMGSSEPFLALLKLILKKKIWVPICPSNSTQVGPSELIWVLSLSAEPHFWY